MDCKLFLVNIAVCLMFLGNFGCSAQQDQMDYRTTGLIEHNNRRPSHDSPPMRLDPQLNAVAEDCARYYAQKHIMDHSCMTGMEVGGHGENIYSEWGDPSPNINQVVRNAVSYWYDENEMYDYANPGKNYLGAGHFTQSMWRDSGDLGIGVATIGDFTTVVAKYRPHGNILGDDFALYKENVIPPRTSLGG